ncbi:MAG: TIGR01212 family radical SAM protein [bacterium]|nr:TIGR01212 family radical SAM protein [bacterium]MDT8395096.1 TIGR01212 family radical SAM protein [bacterium]
MTIRTGKKSQRPFLYRSLSSYLTEVFGAPLRKVPVDPGFGCPNRDGTLAMDGCAFCRLDSFVPSHARSGTDPVEQIARARKGQEGSPFIVYLQAGTGTYTEPDVFNQLVDRLCGLPDVVGFFVGTRPDCIDEPILEALSPWLYRKLIWLELGLQSAHDETLSLLGRGHDVESFTRARELAGKSGIPVLAHVILGLPGEDREKMLQTADYLAGLAVEGVKIHHLQVVRGTRMEKMLADGDAKPLEWKSYPELAAAFLERLPPETVIHRLVADAPREMLIAPRWPDRARVIQAIRDHMEREGRWQGRVYLKVRQKGAKGRGGEEPLDTEMG